MRYVNFCSCGGKAIEIGSSNCAGKRDATTSDFCRGCNLCGRSRRYITKSVETENAAHSYVGVFLLKEHSIPWIGQLKEILNKCNFYLKSIFEDGLSAAEIQNSLIVLLHTMVSFTSSNTWVIFNAENLRVLKPGLHQLCNNVVGFLIKNDFYRTLRVSWQRRLACFVFSFTID